eukprot:TRINITY_DN32946_c1_g1_i4.p1 TRINITY_DN32946_c1_g1~~TRINITY_DN32946_c1_g1_i4.p1  ORF type:complete len:1025 (-),score=291.04 TRINITY_DN32946_c1_g1_i4:393-3467(-)
MPLSPHPHQKECLKNIIKGNTIVNMPTGTGKTLVAVLTIDHFRKKGKVIFIVPTRPLVGQQADYCRKNCQPDPAPVAVMELAGTQTDNLTGPDWQDIVRSNDILVGTAEVFRRALVDTKFIQLSSFSLLIFDECHNAVGNSPMAAIMRDAVHRHRGVSPRILGLTASFVHGSLKGIEKKRQDLEALLQSHIFCPDVEERAMDFERIDYLETVSPDMVQVVENKTNCLLDIAERCGVPLKDKHNPVRRGVHVFSELGMSAFIYFLRECVAPQVQTHLETLVDVTPGVRAQQSLAKIPQLRQQLRDTAEALAKDGQLTALPNVTDKASKLFQLMDKLWSNGKKPRVIVFCEQTVLAHPMAHLLQKHMKCNVGTCTGVGSMTDGQRKEALQKFRSGAVPLLTCTAALEEGLDVSECEVVIRFSAFQTTKSHIQGAGRARKWGARVFYFDNDPGKEKEGASLLEQTAKATALSLSQGELQARRAHSDVQGVHPFRTGSGAEISIFNCVQMVNEYASRTMAASFRPEETMLHYDEEVICQFPPISRKKLVGVTLPSPDGFFDVRVKEVDAWWKDYDLADVADKARMKNWDSNDKELRRFQYVVAVKLSQKGLLDDNNQPSARALRETKHACAAWPMSAGVKIGVKYSKDGLKAHGSHAGSSSAASALTGVDAAGRSLQGSSPSPLPSPSPSSGSGYSPSGSSPAIDNASDTSAGYRSVQLSSSPGESGNFKGALNQVFPDGGLSYSTDADGSGFRSTVKLPDGRQFKGRQQEAAAAVLSAAQGSASGDLLAVVPAARAAASGGSLSSGSSPATATSSAAAAPSPAALQAGRAALGSTPGNYKGAMNEVFPGGGLSYNTEACGSQFRSTVTVPGGRQYKASQQAGTKKAAEQLAACAALAAFGVVSASGDAVAAAAASEVPTAAVQRGASLAEVAAPPSKASRTNGYAGAAPVPARQALPSTANEEAHHADDLLSRIHAALATAEVISLAELVRQMSASKKEVNQQLYELQKRGLATKIAESPPVWSMVS